MATDATATAAAAPATATHLKMSAALEANLEEVTETVSGRVRRPITLMLLLVVGAVVILLRRANFCGRGERAEAADAAGAAAARGRSVGRRRRRHAGGRRRQAHAGAGRRRQAHAGGHHSGAHHHHHHHHHDGAKTAPRCGDGKCELPETAATCFADCPGVTTPPQCGEERDSDPQGHAVVDGRGHHVASAAACCDACAAHAQKNPKRPCNSWVFCYMPHCWSADAGNTHLFGECWLKWQTNPTEPLYGQRGAYTEAYRKRHRGDHLNGKYPTDPNSVKAMEPFGIVPGSQRNLSVPTHVAWAGGVMGARVDLTVSWTTDADGSMRNSKGETVVDYRPWESREQNLKRGVKESQMKFS